MAPTVHLLIDTREPWLHPWRLHWPGTVVLTRATLQTGDLALAGAPDGAIIERKTASDFLGAIGSERIRFDKELLRARFVNSFAIVVEGTLEDVLRQAHARGVHSAAVIGSVAAWTRRGFPVVFASTPHLAAAFALRYLAQSLEEAARLVRACQRTTAPAPSENNQENKI